MIDKGTDGKVSLREAIEAANNTIGLDTIEFKIADPLVGGAHTIFVSLVGLPTIREAVIIDGTTDDDYLDSPVIRLDGYFAGAADGLVLGSGSDGSTIRGLAITDFANGSQGNAIVINSNDNLIVGNYIGVKPDGSTQDSNHTGIDIFGGANNTIGGTDDADRNVIASNTYAAIAIHGSTAQDNRVIGNNLGVSSDGASVLGGHYGVVLWDGADNNEIGGTGTEDGNKIAGYDRGVYVADVGTAPVNISILGNRIYQNDWLGIALSDDGVTANNTAGPGPNNYQNYPVLDSAVTDDASSITITGNLTGVAFADYRIEFFASSAGHATGHGEADVFLGSADVTADNLGVASFAETFSAVVPVGYEITATATDASGNTSEFALNIVANAIAIEVTARETVDADACGQIDYIKITTDANLNDDFSGLSISVAGYTLDATTPYVTNIGVGGDNDNVFYVMLTESGTPDTGATPVVTILANTTLGEFGGGGDVAVDASGVAATDKAGAVLISATSPQVLGTTIFQSVGHQLEFVFSESLSGLPSEVDLETALSFAAGATDGDNLPSIGTGIDSYSLVTSTLTNDTIRVMLNANNTANVGGLIVGTHSVQVTDGTTLTDLAGNTGNTSAAATIVGELNDPPTLTAAASNPTFTEDGAAVTLFSGSSADTVESFQTFAALILTVTNLSDDADEVLGADGFDIELTDGNAGTTTTNTLIYNVSVTGGTATVTLSGGTLTATELQTLVDTLNYHNHSQAPNTTDRVVTLTEVKDSGGTLGGGDDTATLNITSTVRVNALNDAPTLSGGPFSLTGTDEDTISTGVQVSTILAGLTNGDVDGDTLGLAVTTALVTAYGSIPPTPPMAATELGPVSTPWLETVRCCSPAQLGCVTNPTCLVVKPQASPSTPGTAALETHRSPVPPRPPIPPVAV